MKKRSLAVCLIAALLLPICAVRANAYDMADSRRANTISAGTFQSALVDPDGNLWMWGNNVYGQLGNGGKGNATDPKGYYNSDTDSYTTTYYQTVPEKIMDGVVSVSTGGGRIGNVPDTVVSAAVKTDGSLWVWGRAGSGNAVLDYGGGQRVSIQTVPEKLMDGVKSVSVGVSSRCAVKQDGTLWVWGSLGGDYIKTPKKVMDDVAAACAGPKCIAAIKKDGSLWMWGDDNGRWSEEGLGLSQTPKKLLEDVTAVSIGTIADSGMSAYVAAVKKDGSLWMWGPNDVGVLGIDKGTRGTAVPTKVMEDVAAVSAGSGGCTAVIKTDGSLWMWGYDYAGQLGNDSLEDSDAPIKVMENVTAVSVGYEHVIATKTDGTVFAWGNNSTGAVGNGGKGNATDEYTGTNVYQTIPVQLSGLKAGSGEIDTFLFSDVPAGIWYADAVAYVNEKGLMNGVGAKAFAPDGKLTRGQLVTILHRMENEPSAAKSPFTDVPEGQWYAKAVDWAAANGIVNGLTATSFDPEGSITREQMAAILYRYAAYKKYDTTAQADLSGYTDAAKINSYAETAMKWANGEGLINGSSATTLDPTGTATRAQVATILMRFCTDVAK